ncbi:response regulator transcription factor [Caproiciproducens sp. CPB-2]|uniref:response regulator transcription factor n=1 Tax=Caproiciproducens sp. CPB-2 TaxID=3030017 RepID=UPI0023DA6E27|nr:response regulator [Caproiciproducens sp. CPB-2]MDF1493501.1 response regulator [Caproiciproducens sp. CPB-2]
MYKVLIADDEEIIRRGIAGLLKQDREMQVVAQAEDGETALELAGKFAPDLLFVDINMPFLNGIQFIEKLKGVLEDALVVVITGYDDFQYVQSALRLGVYDYLLKPIMEDVFYRSLDRAKEELKRSREQTKYLEWAKVLLEKNKAKLTENFLNDWLGGHFCEEEIDERVSFLKLKFPEAFGVVVAGLDYKNNMEIGGDWNDDLLYYAAENIARELFQPFCPAALFRNPAGNLVMISSSQPQDAWQDTVKQLRSLLEQHLPVRATLAQAEGTGRREIPAEYERALGRFYELMEVPQLIKDVQNYIDENYKNEEFSLQDAACAFHVSPQHLSRVFRHSMGITFVDYVTRARIRKAIELLSNEEMKIYEIAELTGYSSQHYFSSAFKKVLGVSPAEYRKNGQSKISVAM